MKCNFSSANVHEPHVTGKLSISPVGMCNFTWIGRKTEKLWLSIIPAGTRSEQPGLGQPPKGMNYHFSWPHLDELYVVEKLSISEPYICSFSRIGQKINKLSCCKFLPENLENFRSIER